MITRTVPMIPENKEYCTKTYLISSFCCDLLVNELPAQSHKPVSMVFYLGQKYTKILRLRIFLPPKVRFF